MRDDHEQKIQAGLSLLSDLVNEDPRLEAEFAESRSLFVAGQSPDRTDAEVASANRRHLEWFLLERPSPALGGVPAEALRDELLERADDDGDEIIAVLLSSAASAFEVQSVAPGQGVWVSDVFAGGQQPMTEPAHLDDIRPGDLLVGRVYPLEPGASPSGGVAAAGVLHLSNAAASFRDAELVRALRDDIERSRASRRGVMRMEQLELERLFFGDPKDAASTPVTPVELREERFSPTDAAREGLRALGLGEVDIVAALDVMQEAARSTPARSEVVTEILNTWAFDTDIDLGEGQRILAGLWQALSSRPGARKPKAKDTTSAPSGTGEDAERARRLAALGKFDSGRAAGEDVEDLFARLESDLGLTDESDEDASGPIPDFPGVVAAVVEEYLWEAGHDTTSSANADDAGALHLFARYGAELGVFENLGPRELVDFCGRWILEESAVGDPNEAAAALDAMGRFCRWTEEQHGHPLWTPFAESWERLRGDVPRLISLWPAQKPSGTAMPFDLENANADGSLQVRSLNGDPIDNVRVTPALASSLEAGDILHLVVDAKGDAELAACYPGELRRLLEVHAQNADQGN